MCNIEAASDTNLDLDYVDTVTGVRFLRSSKQVWMLEENKFLTNFHNLCKFGFET